MIEQQQKQQQQQQVNSNNTNSNTTITTSTNTNTNSNTMNTNINSTEMNMNEMARTESDLRSGSGSSLKRYRCWNKGPCCCSGGVLFLGSLLLLCTLVMVTFMVYYWTNTCALERELRPGNQSANYIGGGVTGSGDILEQQFNDGDDHLESDVRLPRSLKPLHYNLTIQPYLQEGNFSFDGRVQIRILVLESCKNITMHAFELNITEKDIVVRSWTNWRSRPNPLRIDKHYLVESKHFLVIELLDELQKGDEYLVDIRFHGLMQDYMQGFYHSSYRNGRNETR